MDRKRHFPALGHVEGNSFTISVSGWKTAGKFQHAIQKDFSLSKFVEATRGLWVRGSSTVRDYHCHSSTPEGRYLLFAQQNSSTEEPHLNWGFARLVGSVSQEINFIKTIAAGINFLAIADSRTSFWISDFEYQILIFSDFWCKILDFLRFWILDFFPIFVYLFCYLDFGFYPFSDFGFQILDFWFCF